jgi:hypothetical protein
MDCRKMPASILADARRPALFDYNGTLCLRGFPMRLLPIALVLYLASGASGAAGFVELVTPTPGSREPPAPQRSDPEAVAVSYVAACLTALRATPSAKRRAIGNCEDPALGLDKPGAVNSTSIVRRDGRLTTIYAATSSGEFEYSHATGSIRKKPSARPPQKFGAAVCRPVGQDAGATDFECAYGKCSCRWRNDRLINCTGC